MELDFFETVVTLLLVFHVEDFDELQGYEVATLYIFGLENVGELALAYMGMEI